MKNKNMKIGLATLLISLLIIGGSLLITGFASKTNYEEKFTLYAVNGQAFNPYLELDEEHSFSVDLKISSGITDDYNEQWSEAMIAYQHKLFTSSARGFMTIKPENVLTQEFDDGLVPNTINVNPTVPGKDIIAWEQFLNLNETQPPVGIKTPQIVETSIGFILVIGSVIAAATMSKFIINK